MALLGTKPFQNYIAGEWRDAASGETFESTSPANGEAIGTFPLSGAEDVHRAGARRFPLPLRRALEGQKGGARAAEGARDGEGACRGPWRCPGSDRHG